MSSPPTNRTLEGLIEDNWDESAVTPQVLAALDPYRGSMEEIAADFREDEQSWRDYRHAVWSPVPPQVLDCVGRIANVTLAPKRAPFDAVNPGHYRKHPSGVECIDVAQHFGFNLGSAIKYIWRAGIKTPDPTEDLRKAIRYIEFEIDRLSKEKR